MTAANLLTRQILKYLNRYGCYAWRVNQVKVPGRRFVGKKGVSDICGVSRTGKAIFVEVKVGKDEQSDAQKLFQIEVQKRGAVYIVARILEDVTETGL